MLASLITTISHKKAEFDRLRPLVPSALTQLEHATDLELTYTSNAIEGNTLTRIETNLVIEQGITIGGKKLKDHLEAIDHHDALRYVRELARARSPLAEIDVRNLHALVMQRSDPEIAGRSATASRYVTTDVGRRRFPSPTEVPALMDHLLSWLKTASATPETAFAAHHRLVDIHPFNDGNGRTARLSMNLLLIRGGYPAVSVRPEDRLAYLGALQDAQNGLGDEAFQRLLHRRLDAALDESLTALRAALPLSGHEF